MLSQSFPELGHKSHQPFQLAFINRSIERSANLLIVELLTSVKLIDFREAEKRIS
jgi:hypothetical protein